MDRLTYRDGHGEAWYSGGTPADHLHRLADYEDLEMTPEDIEQTMLNFSSFLMEMTGGRMSKTNYTVQAMVAEANDYHQKELEEAEEKGYDLGVESVLRNHFDIPWAEAADLRKNIDHLRELLVAEREGRLIVLPCKIDAPVYDIRRFYERRKVVRQEIVTGAIDHFTIGQAGKPITTVCFPGNEWADYEPDDLILSPDEAEAALAKDNNVPGKSATDTNVGTKEEE